MNTVEELTIEKTFYRREKDIFGNTERVPYKKRIKRPVERVGQGTRFAYFILDMIFSYVLQIAIATPLIFVFGGSPVIQFVSLLIWFGYYFVFEVIFQQTPGKMIFGYVVINKYAEKPRAGTIALRTVCRMIPFEAFSCLSERGGWHDRFSETYVVSKEERFKLLNLLGNISDETNNLLDSH